MPPAPASSPPSRPLSLGVIFLTLTIDLAGFSLFFPLFPKMLEHYLALEGRTGLLAGFVQMAERLAPNSENVPVLLGGLLGSLYSLLQFVFAPIWGARSDRIGRRPVLLLTVAGTAASYLLWAFSGSFLLFIASRLLGGAMSGNLSVATAAVADVTTRENRAKGMGVIGAAFGLGFIIGPALGGLAAGWNPLETHPHWAAWGVNPFTGPALLAFAIGLLNLLWIAAKFRETLPAPGKAVEKVERPRNPLRALRGLESWAVRRASLNYFLFVLCFSGFELTLGFLAVERLGYGERQLPYLFVFVGLVSILTQGLLVRRLAPRLGEKRLAITGLVALVAGFVGLAWADSALDLYASLAVTSLGSGFVNAGFSALVSLYSPPEIQGRVLGLYRSLGSLARAIGPIAAGLLYWRLGSATTYLLGGALMVLPALLSLRLPRPAKG